MKHWRRILTFDPICSQGICRSWSWAMGRSGRGGTPKRWRIEHLISCPPCTTSFTQLAVGVTLIFPALLSRCFLLVFLPLALRTFGNRALLGSNRLRGSNSFSRFVLPSSLPSFYSGLPLPALQPPLFPAPSYISTYSSPAPSQGERVERVENKCMQRKIKGDFAM